MKVIDATATVKMRIRVPESWGLRRTMTTLESGSIVDRTGKPAVLRPSQLMQITVTDLDQADMQVVQTSDRIEEPIITEHDLATATA